VEKPGMGHYGKRVFLIDGKPREPDTRVADDIVEFRTSGLAKGRHVLRAVAYRVGFVRDQVFAELSFDIGETKRR
jgi:hypothetical protein